MLSIYKVGIVCTHETWKPFRKKDKTKITENRYYLMRPIIAESRVDAIDKYMDAVDIEDAKARVRGSLCWDYDGRTTNHEYKVCGEEYKNITLDDLKEDVPAKDFLAYCRQEMFDINEVIK